MHTKQNERYLITLFLALFFISSAFLFWKNTQELNPKTDKNFWILSFAEPTNQESLAFTVENWTNQDTFSYDISYTVAPNTTTTFHDTFILEGGQSATLSPNITLPKDTLVTTLTVTLGQEKKSLSRK